MACTCTGYKHVFLKNCFLIIFNWLSTTLNDYFILLIRSGNETLSSLVYDEGIYHYENSWDTIAHSSHSMHNQLNQFTDICGYVRDCKKIFLLLQKCRNLYDLVLLFRQLISHWDPINCTSQSWDMF